MFVKAGLTKLIVQRKIPNIIFLVPRRIGVGKKYMISVFSACGFNDKFFRSKRIICLLFRSVIKIAKAKYIGKSNLE